MISILMAVKSGWQFFPQAYASVLAQEHVEWELIVGINGHPSGSEPHRRIAATVSPNAPVDVQLLPDCTNKPQALNSMVKSASGTLVAILDVDDVWCPWKLAKQLAYIRDHDVVGTTGDYFGDAEGPIDVPCGPVAFDDLLQKNCIINSSVLMPRELARWEDTDGLDDYPLWLKLAQEGRRLMNIGGEPLVKIRCHKDQHFGDKRDNSKEIRARFGRAQ